MVFDHVYMQVLALQPHLVDVDNGVRSRALSLITHIVRAVPEHVTALDLQHLSAFYASKLTDWQVLPGSLQGCSCLAPHAPATQRSQTHSAMRRGAQAAGIQGCLALVQLSTADGAPRIAVPDGIALLRSMRAVTVQSLPQADRLAFVRLLALAVQARHSMLQHSVSCALPGCRAEHRQQLIAVIGQGAAARRVT